MNDSKYGAIEAADEAEAQRREKIRKKVKFVFGIPLIFPKPSRSIAGVEDAEKEFKYLKVSQEPSKRELFKHSDDTEYHMPPYVGFILVIVGALVDGFRPISLVWAKDGHASYPFLFSIWIILVKCLVVLFSVFLYFLTPSDQRLSELSVEERLKLSLWLVPPSILYVTSDIINFFMFEYISASTFSVVKQCRLAIVAVLYRFFLGRYISEIQWLAVVQLVMASILFETNQTASAPGETTQYFGILLLLFKCLLDSLAVIWMDKYFKKLDVQGFPYCQQQIVYSIYGLVVGIMFTVFRDGTTIVNYEGSILGDFTTFAWISAFVTAFYGLLVSLVLRYLNSMIKMIQSLFAVIITVLLDFLIFKEDLSALKVIAMCFVFVSVYLYKLGTVAKKVHV